MRSSRGVNHLLILFGSWLPLCLPCETVIGGDLPRSGPNSKPDDKPENWSREFVERVNRGDRSRSSRTL